MALTAHQIEIFETNQRLRDEVFKLVQFEIDEIGAYLRLVDDYDHFGNTDEYLENLTKGKT